MAKRIYGPDTSAYAGAGTGRGPALVKPQDTPTQFGAIDPRSIVNSRLQSLRTTAEQQVAALDKAGLDVPAYNRELGKLQTAYDADKAQMTERLALLDEIDSLVSAGHLSQEAAHELGVRSVMPRHVADALFPKPEGAGDAFSVGQYGAHVRMAREAGEAAIVDPWGFIRPSKRKHADPDKLIDQYRQYRAKIRYDLLSYDEKIQADLAFDEGMGADDKTFKAWQKVMQENPEVKALRTYDPGLMAVAAKKVLGKSVSPLGKSVDKAKRRKQTFSPALAGAMWAPSQAFNVRKAGVTPRRQLNRATGQTRISYDGGKTWQIE